MTTTEQVRVDGLAPLFLAVSASTTRREVSVLLGTALGHTHSIDLGVDVDALYPIDAITHQ